MELAPKAAARDEDEPLAHFGELITELHRDTAAERVPHEGGSRVAEDREQIADIARVSAHRIVGGRLGRFSVAKEVGRNDRKVLGKRWDELFPQLGTAGDSVEQDDYWAMTGGAIAD